MPAEKIIFVIEYSRQVTVNSTISALLIAAISPSTE
jgi:hypothetical protein